ncbi:oxidoreductase [Nocardioides sp. B-3]|uniref:oxidoreductase n=1 Tax=Nocardioides sp. B-3 TaxID=2895565 RepID=UPI002153801A|nr:hypothetical protein [Nocardioides sp. B-3]
MTSLFEPLTLGAVDVPHRVFMAPLTRMRATPPGDVPNALMQDYYVQRASAGLIVSEGTQISPEGKGYMDTPRHLQRRAGRRLAHDHRRGPRRWRADRRAAVARRSRLS